LVRNGFVHKVLGILTVQLFFTGLVVAVFTTNESASTFISPRDGSQGHIWPTVLSLIVTFVCLIQLTCCSDVARSFPSNYIFLLIFTAAESVMLGTVCTRYPIMSSVYVFFFVSNKLQRWLLLVIEIDVAAFLPSEQKQTSHPWDNGYRGFQLDHLCDDHKARFHRWRIFSLRFLVAFHSVFILLEPWAAHKLSPFRVGFDRNPYL